jgi:exopolysaccharide biosynthesis protein
MQLLSFLTVSMAVSSQAQIVTDPWPTPSSKPLQIFMGYGVVNSTGTRFNWYDNQLDDLSRFSVALPSNGCAVRDTTTNTARLHNCAAAVNFGYFQFSAKPTYCLGNIVVNESIVLWSGDGNPMMAVTNTKTTIMGVLAKSDIAKYGVTFAASGFGTLVLDGQVHQAGIERTKKAIKALRPTAEEIAPRTVAGLDAQGRLFLVDIDGVESLNLGLTIDETAEIFAKGSVGFPYALQHAINFDGGGSTTMSTSPLWPFPAQIFNRPTDTDLGPISERDVTTIACIKGE